jgi:two-component system, OmpR family, catabolic regulation response regulator CreB
MMGRMPLILVVDDEPAIADTVLYALRREGMQAEHRTLGREVLPRLREGGVDLVVLDVGLPDANGFDVCRELRRVSAVPVIFLTARDDEIDRVLGLEIGADDYVTKPFSPRELVARVRIRLRDRGEASLRLARYGDFTLDRDGHRVLFHDRPLDLTRYEYALMEALLRRPGAILSRAQLMEHGWNADSESTDRTVDTHIKTLRAKLRAAGATPDPIRTHRGLGYAFER